MAAARSLYAGLRAGLVLATWTLGASAWAQSADRPHHRPQPLPPPGSSPDTGNATGESVPLTHSPRAPPVAPTAPARSALRPLIPAPVLRSAVRSRYSRPATIASSTTGQCRAQCAQARNQCFNADSVDTAPCDPAWTQCLSTCAGTTYSRGP